MPQPGSTKNLLSDRAVSWIQDRKQALFAAQLSGKTAMAEFREEWGAQAINDILMKDYEFGTNILYQLQTHHLHLSPELIVESLVIRYGVSLSEGDKLTTGIVDYCIENCRDKDGSRNCCENCKENLRKTLSCLLEKTSSIDPKIATAIAVILISKLGVKWSMKNLSNNQEKGKMISLLAIYEAIADVNLEKRGLLERAIGIRKDRDVFENIIDTAMEFLLAHYNQENKFSILILLERYLSYSKSHFNVNTQFQEKIDKWLTFFLDKVGEFTDSDKEKYQKICTFINEAYKDIYSDVQKRQQQAPKFTSILPKRMSNFFQEAPAQSVIDRFQTQFSGILIQKPIKTLPTVEAWLKSVTEEKRLEHLTAMLRTFWGKTSIDARIDAAINLFKACNKERKSAFKKQIEMLKDAAAKFLTIVLSQPVKHAADINILEQLQKRYSIGLNYLPNPSPFYRRLLRYLEYACFFAIQFETDVKAFISLSNASLDALRNLLKRIRGDIDFKSEMRWYLRLYENSNKINPSIIECLVNNVDDFLLLNKNYLDTAIRENRISFQDRYSILLQAIEDSINAKELLIVNTERLFKEILFKFLCKLTSKKLIRVNNSAGIIYGIKFIDEEKIICKFDITDFKPDIIVSIKRLFNNNSPLYRSIIKKSFKNTEVIFNLLLSSLSLTITEEERNGLLEELVVLYKNRDYVLNEYYSDEQRLYNTLFCNDEGKLVVFETALENLEIRLADTEKDTSWGKRRTALFTLSMWNELIRIQEVPREVETASGVQAINFRHHTAIDACVQLAGELSLTSGEVKIVTNHSDAFLSEIWDFGKLLANTKIDFSPSKFYTLNRELNNELREKRRQAIGTDDVPFEPQQLQMSIGLWYPQMIRLLGLLPTFIREVRRLTNFLEVLSTDLIDYEMKKMVSEENKFHFEKLATFDGLEDLKKINSTELSKPLVMVCLQKIKMEIDRNDLMESSGKHWIKRNYKKFLFNKAIDFSLEKLAEGDFIEIGTSLINKEHPLIGVKNTFENYIDRLENIFKEELPKSAVSPRDMTDFSIIYFKNLFYLYEEAINKHIELKNKTSKIMMEIKVCLNNLERIIIRGQPPFVYKIKDEENKDELLFLILGDTGMMNQDQKNVAEYADKITGEIKAATGKLPNVRVFLGDNVYPYGVESPHSELFKQAIYDVYGQQETMPNSYRIPGQAILGNHELINVNYKKLAELVYFNELFLNVQGKERGMFHVWHTYDPVTHPGPIHPRIFFSAETIDIKYMRDYKWQYNMPNDGYIYDTPNALYIYLDANTIVQDTNDFLSGKRIFAEDNQIAVIYHTLDDPQHADKAVVLYIHNPTRPCGSRYFKPDTQLYVTNEDLQKLKTYGAGIVGDVSIDNYANVIIETLKLLKSSKEKTVLSRITALFAGHEHEFCIDFDKNLQPPLHIINGAGGGKLQERKYFKLVDLFAKEHGFCTMWVDRHKVVHVYFYSINGGVWYANSQEGLVTKPYKDTRSQFLRLALIDACNDYFRYLQGEIDKNKNFLKENTHHGAGGGNRANNLKNFLTQYGLDLTPEEILNKLEVIKDEYLVPTRNSLLTYINKRLEEAYALEIKSSGIVEITTEKERCEAIIYVLRKTINQHDQFPSMTSPTYKRASTVASLLQPLLFKHRSIPHQEIPLEDSASEDKMNMRPLKNG